MWSRKCRERAPILAELEELGVKYAPIVWTHHGRPHPEAASVVAAIARAAARRHGCTAKAMERPLRGRIGAALARRAARPSLACMCGRWRHDAGELDDAGAWRELPDPGAEVAPGLAGRTGTGAAYVAPGTGTEAA